MNAFFAVLCLIVLFYWVRCQYKAEWEDPKWLRRGRYSLGIIAIILFVWWLV